MLSVRIRVCSASLLHFSVYGAGGGGWFYLMKLAHLHGDTGEDVSNLCCPSRIMLHDDVFLLSGLQMLSRYEALFSRSTFST